MVVGVLEGCRILVAEDEYLIASDAARLLKRAGATIIGPIARLSQVEEQIKEDGFDAAILDIRLEQELVYRAADTIRRSGLPVAFLTGYDDAAIPKRFADVPVCQKPCPDETLIGVVQQICTTSRGRKNCEL